MRFGYASKTREFPSSSSDEGSADDSPILNGQTMHTEQAALGRVQSGHARCNAVYLSYVPSAHHRGQKIVQ
jgi:hypothetical protein